MAVFRGTLVLQLAAMVLQGGGASADTAQEMEQNSTALMSPPPPPPITAPGDIMTPREARILGFLSGMKLKSGSDGVGTLTASNSFRLLGKVVNYALSVSYGDAFLPPTGPTGPTGPFPGPTGPGPFPGQGQFPNQGPFPGPGPFNSGAVVDSDAPEQVEADDSDRENKSVGEFEDVDTESFQPVFTTTTTTTTTTTRRPTTKRPTSPRAKFRKQREDFLKQHNKTVKKVNAQLQQRKLGRARGK